MAAKSLSAAASLRFCGMSHGRRIRRFGMSFGLLSTVSYSSSLIGTVVVVTRGQRGIMGKVEEAPSRTAGLRNETWFSLLRYHRTEALTLLQHQRKPGKLLLRHALFSPLVGDSLSPGV